MTTTTTSKGGKVYLSVVDQWLDTLPAAESEDFREFAEVTPSVIEIWVYAGIVYISCSLGTDISGIYLTLLCDF